VDGRGVPLSLIVTGANRHDVSQLTAVLDAIVIAPPKKQRYLYADKGYDGEVVREQIRARGYTPRVARKKRKRGRPLKNRRWVVEAAHSWFNRFRKLLVRYEKLS
jgi:IS5 family transposase